MRINWKHLGIALIVAVIIKSLLTLVWGLTFDPVSIGLHAVVALIGVGLVIWGKEE